MDYKSHLESVTEDHGHTDSRVGVLSVHHRLRKRLLHLLPQHLVASERAPATHNPADPRLLQMLNWHHGGDVVQYSAAQRPGHVAKGEVIGGDVGDLTKAEGVCVSLPGWWGSPSDRCSPGSGRSRPASRTNRNQSAQHLGGGGGGGGQYDIWMKHI